MKESITLRLDKELIAFIKKAADEDLRSVSNYIEVVLTKHKQEKESPAK